MPAANIERSLAERVPGPVLAWCNGQSLESRYSTSVPAPVAGAAGRVGGAAVLRHQLTKAQRDDAVSMPRFPVIAVTEEQIYVFDGPVARGDAVAVLERSRSGFLVTGKGMWRRLDIVSQGPPSQSYTVLFNVLFGSRRRLDHLLRTLGAQT
jgi:hypothetical protein